MLYSKVRIEWSEDLGSGAGVFNTFAHESGTTGEVNIGEDLADTVGNLPRPLLVLAQAVCLVYDKVKDKTEPPPFLRAAMDLVRRWEKYDTLPDHEKGVLTNVPT